MPRASPAAPTTACRRDTVIGAAVAIGETRWSVAGLGKRRRRRRRRSAAMPRRAGTRSISPARVAGAWHRADDRPHASPSPAPTGSKPTSTPRASARGSRAAPLRHGALRAHALRRGAGAEPAHARPTASAPTAGSNQFALTYAAQTATDTRSELGVWVDTRQLLANGTTAGAARPRRLGARLRSGLAASTPRSRRCRAQASPSTAPPPRAMPRSTSAVAELQLHQRRVADRQARRRIRTPARTPSPAPAPCATRGDLRPIRAEPCPCVGTERRSTSGRAGTRGGFKPRGR